MELAYKIILSDGRTLFKAIEGSRTLRYNVWLKAEKKLVIDGSGGMEYISGIHVFKDKELAVEYLDKFFTPKNRIVIECYVRGLRKKPTKSDVWLADEICVPSS